ncbi:hypothetical protein EJB05_43913, partial [Eragrostis curvula]
MTTNRGSKWQKQLQQKQLQHAAVWEARLPQADRPVRRRVGVRLVPSSRFDAWLVFFGATTYDVHRSIKNNEQPPTREQMEALQDYINSKKN